MIWTEYTKNMYLGRINKLWTWMNEMRLRIVCDAVEIHYKIGSVLEVGSYDLYGSYYLITHAKFPITKITFSDKYDSEIYSIAECNKETLNEWYPMFKFELLNANGEDYKFEKHDNLFVFETFEYIIDEKKAIENLEDKADRIFISYPVESGFIFAIKTIARKILVGTDNHSLLDILRGLLGIKIKRVIGDHKGYDYRETIKMFKNFKVKSNKFYPFNCAYFAYGGVCVLERI